jgi:hypothetical protein
LRNETERIISGGLTASERSILKAIAEHEPCSVYDLATIRHVRKHGYTDYAYGLVHREHARLLRAELIVLVGKSRGRPKGPVPLETRHSYSDYEVLPSRKKSTKLYGLTFLGYVEYAAFSQKGCLTAAENHRRYLSYPLFDYLTVFAQILSSRYLEIALWQAALSTLNVTRFPMQQGESEAKQHFAVAFIIQMYRILSPMRRSELRSSPITVNSQLHEFILKTLKKEQEGNPYTRLDIVEKTIAAIMQPAQEQALPQAPG